VATDDLDASAPVVAWDREPLQPIDLAPLFGGHDTGRDRVVDAVRERCQETGFFSVRNTCVDSALLDEALTQARRFFDLPDESPIKRKVHNGMSPGGIGWGPMFQEPAYQPGTVAHMESFDVSPPVDWIGNLALAESLGIYPNVWPELDCFRPAIEGLYKAIRRLSDVLFEVFAQVLELPADYFRSRATTRAPSSMRLLHYPGNERPSRTSNVGIAAHTDFECFTVMIQTARGLELTDVNGRWREAPARPGEIVVILGDMLERLSNGAFKATGHRVGITGWQRYAVVLFNALDGDCQVAPLPNFVTPSRPAAYAPITQSAHIADEVARARARLQAHRDQGPAL